MLRLWEHCKLRELQKANLNSISIAKQTALIESALASFSGEKNFKANIKDQLPFQELEDNSKVEIDEQTAWCFWQMMDDENVPNEFFHDYQHEGLMDKLKAFRN